MNTEHCCTTEQGTSEVLPNVTRECLELFHVFKATTWRSDGDARHVLSVLEKQPDLAQKKFSSCHNHEITPLCCILICANCNLEIIQAVWNLNPTAATEPQGKQKDTALHFACRYGAPDPVVEFIYRRNPSALSYRNTYGQSPIDYILLCLKSDIGTHARLRTLKLLVGLNPSVVWEKNPRGDNLLEAAFRTGCTLSSLGYIAQQCPDQRRLDISYKIGRGTHLGLPEATILCQLLPRLKGIVFQEGTFSCSNGLAMLLKNLAENPSIEELHGLTLPHTHSLAFSSLTNMLQKNSFLRVLSLKHILSRDEDSRAFLQAVFTGLSANECLEVLELQEIRYSDLHAFLPRMAQNLPQKSALRQLRISKCRLSGNCLVEMCTLLPSLADLDISAVVFVGGRALQRANLTVPLVQILDQHHLTRLSVVGCTFKMDVGQLCEAIKRNPFLKHYTIESSLNGQQKQAYMVAALQQMNTTLEEIGSVSFEKTKKGVHFKRIDYFLKLNKFGRQKTRDEATSKEIFVRLLDEVNSDSGQSLQEQDKHSIQFGLLLEAPCIWTR